MQLSDLSNWRKLVPESEQEQMIGHLMKQKHEAQVGRDTLDAKLKTIGRELETLGSVLKNTVAGGDYRDLLGPLERLGVDAPKIDTLLKERSRLSQAIQQCKDELAKLGV